MKMNRFCCILLPLICIIVLTACDSSENKKAEFLTKIEEIHESYDKAKYYEKQLENGWTETDAIQEDLAMKKALGDLRELAKMYEDVDDKSELNNCLNENLSSEILFDIIEGQASQIAQWGNNDFVFTYKDELIAYYSDALEAMEEEHGKMVQYEQALDLVASGNFIDAYSLFVELGDYKDSQEQCSTLWEDQIDSFYELAISYYNVGTEQMYHEAKDLFQKIGDYKDSEDYLSNIEWIENMNGTYCTQSGLSSHPDEYYTYYVIDYGSVYEYKRFEKGGAKTSIITEFDGHMCLYAATTKTSGTIFIYENGVCCEHVNAENGKPTSYISGTFSPSELKRISRSTTPLEYPSIGMNPNEVYSSTWGKPKKVNESTYTWGTSEQWVYPGNRYIYLENGVVTSIQK